MKFTKAASYIFFLVPAILLFLAPLMELPYGFYTFLRIIILISSAYMIFVVYMYKKKIDLIAMLFIIILILYNPIIPIHLNREIWTPINFMTSGVYIWAFLKVRKAILKL